MDNIVQLDLRERDAPISALDQLVSLGIRFGTQVAPVVVDDDPAWTPVPQLFDPDDPTISAFIDRIERKRQAPTRQVAAMLAWKMYTFLSAQTVVGAWAAFGWVPDFSRENTAVKFDHGTGRPQIAMLRSRIHVGVGDARSTMFSDAATVTSDDPLATMINMWWGEHFEPVIERWQTDVRLGRRGLVAFAVAQATTIVARATDGSLHERHEAIKRWTAALPASMQAMAPVAEQRRHDTTTWTPMPIRTSCCLQYELDPPEYCTTCNLLTDTERTKLLADHGTEWRHSSRPMPNPT